MVSDRNSVEVLRPRDQHEWHEFRSRDVTASVMGALFECHPYTSEYELWIEKTSPFVFSPDNQAMRRGRLLEPVAVQMIVDDFPSWEITYSTETSTYYRDAQSRIGATPDVIASTSEGVANVQIKSVAARAFKKSWYGEDGEIEPPLWIALQAECERCLVAADLSYVAALVIDAIGSIDLHMVRIPSTAGLYDAMSARSLEFWDRVEGRLDPPTPDFTRDSEAIRKRHSSVDPEHEISLTENDRIEALILERAQLAENRQRVIDQIDRIDAEIRHTLGSASVAHLRGNRKITAPNKYVDAMVMPGRTVRSLRLPKPIGEING